MKSSLSGTHHSAGRIRERSAAARSAALLALGPIIAILLLLANATAARSAVDLSRIHLPAGFHISVFADDLQGARFMVFDPSGGILLVSLTQQGRVMALPDAQHAGQAVRPFVLIEGLELPHGLAFSGKDLYVAETARVLRFPDAEGAIQAGRTIPKTQGVVVVPSLPAKGMHFTRTIVFGPSGDFFVSVGSDCNACVEKDPRRAAILRFPPDGGSGEVYASGLRNAVGLRFNPLDKKLWATVNGRDWLGDDLPPEDVSLITQGGNYGWPYCYGNNVPDPQFHDPGHCRDTIPATFELPAHNAPLGLDFYTGGNFPPEYRGDLFVALHGSWNRSQPDGYKVVRIHMQNGKPQRWEDFATGWLQGRKVMGRPVDVLQGPDSALYVSDDYANVIYRIAYRK